MHIFADTKKLCHFNRVFGRSGKVFIVDFYQLRE